MKRTSGWLPTPPPARLRLISFLAVLLTASNLFAGTCITDDTGTQVCLEKPAQRVISLYGAFNEILAEMGLEDRIIARTSSEDRPASIRNRPVIGTHIKPNTELIVGFRPDVVLQSGGRTGALLPVQQLRENGVPVAVFSIRNFEELFSAIKRIGILTGGEQQADRLILSMKKRLADVKAALGDAPRPSICFEVRYPNLLGAGRDSFVNEVIEHAGGVNGLTLQKKFVRLSEETLLAIDPDFYVVQKGPMNPDPMLPGERDHYRTLSAVRNNRIFVVDEHLFSRPGPRSVEAVEKLAAILHPEANEN